MGIEHDLDFSARSAPEAWFEAAAQGPQGEDRPLARPGVLPILPSAQGINLVMACLMALAVCVVCGYAWYQLDTTGTLTTPWLAVGLGVIVAISVRLGGGRRDGETRAALSGLFYLATLLIVTFLASRHTYMVLYGDDSSLASFEEELVRSRFRDPLTLAAWITGALAAVRLSFMLGDRH